MTMDLWGWPGGPLLSTRRSRVGSKFENITAILAGASRRHGPYWGGSPDPESQHQFIIACRASMSMRKDQELTVITKTYDLFLWSCNHTGKFPRNHRFGRGNR